MVRAMAKEAEATRERKAALIRASGEEESATKLREAAKLLTGTPVGLELRHLQTLERIAKEPNQTTYVLPQSLLDDSDSLVATAMAGTMTGKDGHMPVFDNDDDDNQRLQMEPQESNDNSGLNMTLGQVLEQLMGDSRGGDGNEPVFR